MPEQVGRPEGESPINEIKLAKMLREGKTKRQCADEFGVSLSAIKYRLKKIKKDISSPPTDPIGQDNIDSIKQLKDINNLIIGELQRCNKLILREESKIKIANNLAQQLEEHPEDVDLKKQVEKLIESNTKGILTVQSNIINISGEVRKQIELQLKIAETLYNIKMISEFQSEIIALLKDVDPIVAEKLIHRLKERRSVRGLIALR